MSTPPDSPRQRNVGAHPFPGLQFGEPVTSDRFVYSHWYTPLIPPAPSTSKPRGGLVGIDPLDSVVKQIAAPFGALFPRLSVPTVYGLILDRPNLTDRFTVAQSDMCGTAASRVHLRVPFRDGGGAVRIVRGRPCVGGEV